MLSRQLYALLSKDVTVLFSKSTFTIMRGHKADEKWLLIFQITWESGGKETSCQKSHMRHATRLDLSLLLRSANMHVK